MVYGIVFVWVVGLYVVCATMVRGIAAVGSGTVSTWEEGVGFLVHAGEGCEL